MLKEDVAKQFSEHVATTHLDLRKMSKDTNDLSLKHINEWQAFTSKYARTIMEVLQKDVPDEVAKQRAEELCDEMNKIAIKQAEENQHHVAKTAGDAFQMGYLEGHTSSAMKYSALLEGLIKDERIIDPFGSIERLTQTVRSVIGGRYEELTKGKPLTVLSRGGGEKRGEKA